MARYIKTNGASVDVSPRNGRDFSLEELQGFVGGYIEIVYLSDDEIMVVNEEGKINGLPMNEEATRLFPSDTYGFDIIVGDVLVCKSDEVR